MKILSRTLTPVMNDAMKALPVKVCMHVLTAARTDNRVMRAATSLVYAGFEVSIVDIACGENVPLEEDIHGVHVKHIIMPDSFASTRFTRRVFSRAAKVLIKSIFLLLRTPADIYHTHDDATLPASSIAAWLRRKPLIFDAHELPLEVTSIRWYWLLHLFSRLFTIILPCCAGVITVSPPIAQEIQERYHISEVSIIRNVPPYRSVTRNDRLRQHLNLGPNVRIALYQGNLQPERALDKLILAAPFLEPDIVIVLMGSDNGATRAQLEALVATKRVTERVKILPPVPYNELLDWTASADIGLLIYTPGKSLNIQMCLPNKIFEYLMAGLPILSSQLDAVSELVITHDVGNVVSSLAPKDIATAINTMLVDPLALSRMHHNALKVAHDEYCWEKENAHLVQFYQKILQRK